VQDCIEQRFVNPDTAVVFNKSQLTEAIHEEADPGPRGTNHFRQSFLCDLRNHHIPLAGPAEFRHQQENPRQPLFTGVEKLIDKIGLASHAAGQQELEEQIREGVLFV
jgi:hypothetical protein